MSFRAKREISQSALAEFQRERSAEARSSGEINLPSLQPTLMLRVSGASLCRDDTFAEILVLLDNIYIISPKILTNGLFYKSPTTTSAAFQLSAWRYSSSEPRGTCRVMPLLLNIGDIRCGTGA